MNNTCHGRRRKPLSPCENSARVTNKGGATRYFHPVSHAVTQSGAIERAMIPNAQ
ncbi:MAG: hypothetical protein II375_00585 [Bacteroidales bacterium]|nr:hypothetical protein [Bacteroidales bacterium]